MPDEKEKRGPEEQSAAAGMPAPGIGKPPTDPTAEPDDIPDDEDYGDDEELGDVDESQMREYTIDEADVQDAIESSDAELRRTTALPPSAWITSPARVELTIESIKVMLSVARLRQSPAKKFPYVRLMLLAARRLLLVAPTTETDPKAIEATRSKKGPLKFNAISVLQPAQMTLEKGYRERYKVGRTSESPIGPALVIDMSRPVSVKIVKARKTAKKGRSNDASKEKRPSAPSSEDTKQG